VTRNAYVPLDVACPACRAIPGRRCVSLVLPDQRQLRRPHADRVTAARDATTGRAHPPVPAHVSDAWTCPTCDRSYWPPAEWESELWPAVRQAAQELHGRRHQQERAAAGHSSVAVQWPPALSACHPCWDGDHDGCSFPGRCGCSLQDHQGRPLMVDDVHRHWSGP
jgi:hypothetical protein